MCSSLFFLFFVLVLVCLTSAASNSAFDSVVKSKGKQKRRTSKVKLRSFSHKYEHNVIHTTAAATATTSGRDSKTMVAKSPRTKWQALLSILLPWLYFMSTSLQIPSLPKYVNYVVNKGDTSVSPESAAAYGILQGMDSLFTFLSVNAIGLLSDKYGRIPFMMYSSAGLGTAFAMILNAQNVNVFYIAAAIDGCSSCMLSQAQAYVADITGSGEDISIALGQFQGFAVGQ